MPNGEISRTFWGSLNVLETYNTLCSEAALTPSAQLQRIFRELAVETDGEESCMVRGPRLTVDASQCLFTRSHFDVFLDVVRRVLQNIAASQTEVAQHSKQPIRLHLAFRNTGLDNGTVLTLANEVSRLEEIEDVVVAETLDISDNINVSTVGGKRLKRLCKDYRYLRCVLVRGCSLNAALERQIAEAAAENAALSCAPQVCPVVEPAEDTSGAETVRGETRRAESPDYAEPTEHEAAASPLLSDEGQKTPQTEPRNSGQQVPLSPSPPKQPRCASKSCADSARSPTKRVESSDNLSYTTADDPEMKLAYKSQMANTVDASFEEGPVMTSFTLPPDLQISHSAQRENEERKLPGPVAARLVEGTAPPQAPAAFPLLMRLIRATKGRSSAWPSCGHFPAKMISNSSTPRLDALLEFTHRQATAAKNT